MDSRIIDTLAKLGFITHVGIKADAYESVDELIANGFITVPGAKAKIDEIIKSLNITEVDEVEVEPKTNETVMPAPTIVPTPVETNETKVEDKEDDKEIIVDDKEDEAVVTEQPKSKATKTKSSNEVVK